MKIDNRLTLAIPLKQLDGTEITVRATQMPRDVFKIHYMTFARVFTAIYDGIGGASGPRIAAHLLRDVAKQEGVFDGANGVDMTVFKELERTSMVTTANGSAVTLADAIKSGMLDEEDRETVENALVFFTVVCLMHTKEQRLPVLGLMSSLWNAQVSSSTPTAPPASSAKSIETGSSGETTQRAAVTESGSALPS